MASNPWRVRLEGDALDLKALVRMFTAPGLRIVEDQGDAYFLESETFQGQPNHLAVFAEAERLLPLINGTARLSSSGHRDVTLSGHLIQPGRDGEPKQHHVVVSETITLRTSFDAVVIREEIRPDTRPPTYSTRRLPRRDEGARRCRGRGPLEAAPREAACGR